MRNTGRSGAALGAVVLLAVTVIAYSFLTFLLPIRRTRGVQFGQTLSWMGGTVEILDYCFGPGTYDNQIEWAAANGERKLLLRVGDTIPDLNIDQNGALVSTMRDWNGQRVISTRVTWRDLRSPPVRRELEGES